LQAFLFYINCKMNKIGILFLIMAGTLLFACNNNNNNGSGNKTVLSGEQLFKINCAQCHKPAEDFTGPALKNVASRWKDKKLLYEFIKAPQEVINRDAYAKDLFIKWKQVYMQPFPDLSDEDIDRILSYCDTAN
jgi:cytochrome c551/c552